MWKITFSYTHLPSVYLLSLDVSSLFVFFFLPIFNLGFYFFFLLIFKNSSCVLDNGALSDASFTNILSQSASCLLIPIKFFHRIGIFNFNKAQLITSLIFFLTLFFAALGLCCCTQTFSICSEWGLLSICNTWASYCGGFFCCRSQALGYMGFSSCGMRALEYRLSSRWVYIFNCYILGIN